MTSSSGVFMDKKKNGEVIYRSSIYYKKKHISLGSFRREADARDAYLLAGDLLTRTPRMRLEDYDQTSPLSFSKWVCLINFRDTGRYWRTPVLVRGESFSYYIAPGYRLTFDLTDLPFFGTHAITRRGRHLCVTTDGRQVGILTRFGIHPYAVRERDYTFLDGNPRNLRRDNIQILNRWHGVRKEQRLGMPVYAARIHVNGDLLIGRYPTEEEAAIAYNKAADLLKEAGYLIDFPRNQLSELDDFDRERIYTLVKISERILDMAGMERG